MNDSISNPKTKSSNNTKKNSQSFQQLNPFYSLNQCEKNNFKKFNKNFISKSHIFSKFNNIILNQFIFNKNTHLVSTFKEHLIYDFIDEFLTI